MPDENAEIDGVTPAPEVEPSPVAAELEKEQNRNKRSEKEKAEYSLKMNAKRLTDLGGNPNEILGVREAPQKEEGEVPQWYRKEKQKEVQKTALQFADELEDANDKALVTEYLTKRIVPSENAQDDFRLALGAVNALKNKQIVEEVMRRSSPRVTASGGSSPARTEAQFEPTTEEAVLMRPPYSLSKELVIASRGK